MVHGKISIETVFISAQCFYSCMFNFLCTAITLYSLSADIEHILNADVNKLIDKARWITLIIGSLKFTNTVSSKTFVLLNILYPCGNTKLIFVNNSI